MTETEFTIPQTPGQLRSSVYLYPVQKTVDLIANRYLRLCLFFLLPAITLHYTVHSIFIQPMIGRKQESLIDLAITSLLIFSIATYPMLLLASQLLIRKLSETQYSKYQSTHWQVAIDASFLWIKLSNGHFSQIPLKDITDAYFTEDALVVNHFPNMSFVISDKEFTDPEYRSRATQYLTDAQKLKTLTPIGMLAQKQTSPQNQS